MVLPVQHSHQGGDWAKNVQSAIITHTITHTDKLNERKRDKKVGVEQIGKKTRKIVLRVGQM